MSGTNSHLNAIVREFMPLLQAAPGTGELTAVHLDADGTTQAVYVESIVPFIVPEESLEEDRLTMLLNQVQDLLWRAERDGTELNILTNQLTVELLIEIATKEQACLFSSTTANPPETDPGVQRITELLDRTIRRETQLKNAGIVDEAYTGWWQDEDIDKRDEVDSMMDLLEDEERKTGLGNVVDLRTRARAQRAL